MVVCKKCGGNIGNCECGAQGFQVGDKVMFVEKFVGRKQEIFTVQEILKNGHLASHEGGDFGPKGVLALKLTECSDGDCLGHAYTNLRKIK